MLETRARKWSVVMTEILGWIRGEERHWSKGRISKHCDSWPLDLADDGCRLVVKVILLACKEGRVAVTRLLLALIPAIALTGFVLGGEESGDVAALQSCDESYPTVCLVPGSSYTCFDIGFPITVIYDPSSGRTDPYHLDSDFDGVGCEDF